MGESVLEYFLQMQQEYWHILKASVQLMTICVVSICFLGLYPSIFGARPKMRARCRRQVRSTTTTTTTRSTRVSFTSSPSRGNRVRGVQHTRQRHVITYII